MISINTPTGLRLYVERPVAFLAKASYTDAWGQHKVSGTLFDLETGEIQRNAICWCNMAVSEAEIVYGAMVGR